MTQDEIIEMANDAELCQTIWIDDSDDEMVRTVIAFAKLVAAKEREACAELVEWIWGDTNDLADAIRERGEA